MNKPLIEKPYTCIVSLGPLIDKWGNLPNLFKFYEVFSFRDILSVILSLENTQDPEEVLWVHLDSLMNSYVFSEEDSNKDVEEMLGIETTELGLFFQSVIYELKEYLNKVINLPYYNKYYLLKHWINNQDVLLFVFTRNIDSEVYNFYQNLNE